LTRFTPFGKKGYGRSTPENESEEVGESGQKSQYQRFAICRSNGVAAKLAEPSPGFIGG
jgi:hypothetical protein